MRRTLFLAMAGLLIVGVMAPLAHAQAPAAPAPKVTITGFIQQVTSWNHNLSLVDIDPGRTNDTEWYARTRLRLDFAGQVGKVTGMFSIEVDNQWGLSAAAGGDVGGTRTGTTAAFDLNIDNVGAIEHRWLYTEFPVTGDGSLIPFVPVPTVGRFGGQPFATTYKGGVLATGDFGGVNLVTTWTPNVKTHFTYVQVEEQSSTVPRGFFRGDDHAIIFSVDATPMKGLNVRPIYAYLFVDGVTSGSARQSRGGFANTAAVAGGGPHSPGGGLGFTNGLVENRHTIGFDARWRSGPWSLEPTLFYQFGNRETVLVAALAQEGPAGALRDADISAWFLDIRGGYRVGPLLLEAMTMYTTGNRAQDKLSRNINFYQHIDTDTTYYATWAEIFALNVDFTQIGTVGGSFGNAIGYDRYGRIQVGARAFYDVTPALTLEFKTTTAWTDKSVDVDGTRTAAAGITPSIVNRRTGVTARPDGDASYLGTEFDVGFTWRFAPAVFFQAVYGYMVAGGALGARSVPVSYCNTGGAVPLGCSPPNSKDRDANDVQIFSARVNYSF